VSLQRNCKGRDSASLARALALRYKQGPSPTRPGCCKALFCRFGAHGDSHPRDGASDLSVNLTLEWLCLDRAGEPTVKSTATCLPHGPGGRALDDHLRASPVSA
jgi:hypothetical protein